MFEMSRHPETRSNRFFMISFQLFPLLFRAIFPPSIIKKCWRKKFHRRLKSIYAKKRIQTLQTKQKEQNTEKTFPIL
jgi:hypothetical protein